MSAATEPHPHTAIILVHPPPGIPSDVLAGFLSRCRGRMAYLRAALERGEFDAVRVFGHRLKGTGGAYGVPKLTEIGNAVERAAVDKNSDELRHLAGEAEAYLSQLRVAPD
jgi:HPt (histidine-containing phosphotransfer) domain-containing protein